MRYQVPVIALHCSGAGASEWYSLAEALGDDYELLAPEHYGSASNGAWTGEHAFTLADDAARAIALVDASQSKVHLVGHSYGGGVALHVALARLSQIASMVLYEPSAFHLLRQLGEPGAEAFSEIAGVARQVADGVLTGDYRRALAGFVDYWSGIGTWERMRPAATSHGENTWPYLSICAPRPPRQSDRVEAARCPLLAQSRNTLSQCPLLGVKRTSVSPRSRNGRYGISGRDRGVSPP